ncbi:MAG: phosphate signaling complex PhoU family protein, partial [Betaproteobacteria bacterium]
MVSGDHSMRKYDEELEAIRSRVLHMGGLVESQVRTALAAFEKGDLELAQQAIDADRRVNDLELELDQMVIHVIARRQP